MTFVITVKLIKMLGEANRDVLNKYEKNRKVMKITFVHLRCDVERICKHYAVASKGRGILPTTVVVYRMHTPAQKVGSMSAQYN